MARKRLSEHFQMKVRAATLDELEAMASEELSASELALVEERIERLKAPLVEPPPAPEPAPEAPVVGYLVVAGPDWIGTAMGPQKVAKGQYLAPCDRMRFEASGFTLEPVTAMEQIRTEMGAQRTIVR